jgi:ABC-type oligopeptide transport system substrate-binding subunit
MRIANRATGNHPLARFSFETGPVEVSRRVASHQAPWTAAGSEAPRRFRARFAQDGLSGFRSTESAIVAALCRRSPRWPLARRAVALLRKLTSTFILLASAFLLAGCFRTEPPADITICNANEPESLDPHIVTGVSEMRITKALFDGLTKLDPQHAAPGPGLAERWEISPDGRTYTFHLRTNAVWSTGEPITSADVMWSWFRALNPLTAGDYAGQLFYIKNAEAWYNGAVTNRAEVGIHAPDDFTVQVELNAPIAFFLELCAFPTLAVVPRQVIEK